MKYLRKFESVQDLETVIASSEIGILGLAYDGSTPVMENKPTPPPAPVIKYTLTVYLDPDSGAGYVTGLEASYAANAVAEITAYDNSGFEFDHWENEDGDVIGNNRVLRYTVTSSCDIYAVYSIREVKWNLTASILPAGADSVCDVLGTGEKSQGSNATLEARCPSIYTFDHWELGGVNKGTTSSILVPNIQSDLNYTAVFRYINQDRTITVTSNDPSYGTVKIESSYHYTTSNTSLAITEVVDEATMTATPNSGYQFDGWYYNNEKVSSNAVYTFTLPEHSTDRTYTANFIEVQA